MSRKKQWGTNPTEMQWPKIWRHCHTVRAEKTVIKAEKAEALLESERNLERITNMTLPNDSV